MRIMRILISMFILVVIRIGSNNTVFAQSNSVALAAADTSKFSPNTTNGWQLFNSYVFKYQSDSSTLQVIIQHANNIDWTQEQLVGRITYQPLKPSANQSISFNFATNIYMLRIDTVGNCFLRLADGALPGHDPFVIPITVFYKL